MWTKGLLDLAVAMGKYWGETRIDYDVNQNAIYVGVSKTMNLSTSSGNHWLIQKLTYDANNNCTRIQQYSEYADWDNRTFLSW